MRMPSRTELSIEQEKIYQDAPLDGTVIIIGPPGTGKTVLAVYRSKLLARKDKNFRLVMFNKVLLHYTMIAMAEDDLDSHVSTWHKWIGSWWKKASNRWPPKLDRANFDFTQMILAVAEKNLSSPENLNWGHLVIDEGQDFPKDFYALANIVMRTSEAAGDNDPPDITVLADENQRLNSDRHSTIREICQALSFSADPYKLSINFRNTFEIARFSKHFFDGAPTEIPELPEERRGGMPEIWAFDKMEEEAMHIVNYARLNDDETIGVFAPSHKVRKNLMAMLEGPAGGAGIRLQSYHSHRGEWDDASELDFQSGGSITIICDASCKGLEFDAVFIPQLQQYNLDGTELNFFKRKMYVMCSRAREHLELSWSNCDGLPEIAGILPQPEEGIVEWEI